MFDDAYDLSSEIVEIKVNELRKRDEPLQRAVFNPWMFEQTDPLAGIHVYRKHVVV